jgi:hypothetical protein
MRQPSPRRWYTRVKRTFSTTGPPGVFTRASARPVTMPVSPSTRICTSCRSTFSTETPMLGSAR